MMARAVATASVLLISSSAVLLGSEPGTPFPEEGSKIALPASLDALYPPKAPAPTLFLAMHGLNTPLMGIVVDLSEEDPDGVAANFEKFRTRYEEVAGLVPEWQSWYPTEPVEELGRAVKSGNPDEIMAAVGQVGSACHQCHVLTMVPTHQKYHWPSFSDITVDDPVLKQELPYPAFMQMLNTSLTGIGVNLEQGQMDNARSQLTQFQLRMTELHEVCDACHDTERTYFVDERVMSLITQMKTALEAEEADADAVTQLTHRIGEEACFRCHLVHLPAAYSRSASH